MTLAQAVIQKERAEVYLQSLTKLNDPQDDNEIDGLQNNLQWLDRQIFEMLPEEIPIQLNGIKDIAHKGDPLTKIFVTPDNKCIDFDTAIKAVMPS